TTKFGRDWRTMDIRRSCKCGDPTRMTQPSSTRKLQESSASRCLTHCNYSPTRKSNEQARVHHAARRRGRHVAARGARAAGEETADHGLARRRSAISQRAWVDAFVQRLRELGWIDGRNGAIEYRWGEGRAERFAEIAAEFVRRKVDVILAGGP